MSAFSHVDNPRSIKYYVKRYLSQHAASLKGKTIIDFPAGNGVTSRLLLDIDAKPMPFDLFPEYFELDSPECLRANIRDGLPVDDATADGLICQEGIEHFSDQFSALKEFNRVLKKDGTLLITTPNYSNLCAKFSYAISESEKFNSTMPPNEFDSVWMSQQHITDEVYFGHIFLLGFQKLRVLAKLSGFKVKAFHFTRMNLTSLVLFPFFYPFILLLNWLVYQKRLKKCQGQEEIKQTYNEVFKYAISPKVLLSSGLMVEFSKEQDAKDVTKGLRSCHQDFGNT